MALKKKKTAAKIFAGQFHDAMVMILLAAAAVSVAVGKWSDAIPIVLIVVMNAALGFVQEYRCEKTLEEMKRLSAPTARVRRNGEKVIIPADEIKVGDSFFVEAGDRFPADCIIISQSSLCCDEAVLTGESEAVTKREYHGEADRSSQSLAYMGYAGASVLKGTAECEACAVGENTLMGGITKLLSDIDDEQTPLQKRLAGLGKIMVIICIIVCILVFVVGVLRGEDTSEMFFTAVTAAIAAIPEGLPAAVTIALALAVRRMLKQNALVHSLHSVETLGCANVICTDKTGTLTQNNMAVRKLAAADTPDSITDADRLDSSSEKSSSLRQLLLCALLCNNAEISHKAGKSGRNRQKPAKLFTGDPTETALLRLCDRLGVTAEGFERISEKPFDSESRYMSVTCRKASGGTEAVFIKGAAESVIPLCSQIYSENQTKPLDEKTASSLLSVNDRLAGEGLRTLAFAVSISGKTAFLGFAGLSDPLREGAAEAVAECRHAGISTVMITGDHKLTACAAAREAGILTPSKRVLTGTELDALTDEQLAEQISDISVFARVTPAHKLRIVRAFRSRGAVCAMTGDGVNDAPAVKEADIGVAMGINGTDVTRQAADMVLLDDNFTTLVSAVREGRTIYSNIRKFVRYLTACNIGEVLTMLGAAAMGIPVPLVPAQLLLVNLVTDGLPAAALSAEKAEPGIMQQKPRPQNEGFFSDGLLTRILTRGVLIAICTLACFTILLTNSRTLAQARTGAMITLVLSQLIHTFECRDEHRTLFEISPKGSGAVVLSVLVSLLCTAVCFMIPDLAGIFALCRPDSLVLAVSTAMSLSIPVFSGIIGCLRKQIEQSKHIYTPSVR